MKSITRTPRHRRDERLEDLLSELNGLLTPLEKKIIESIPPSRHPIILIFGVARSGTTLLLQWLAGTGHFCYPTNMLSRFYAAPYIGAKIQLMLTRHDFNREIFDFNPEVPFASDLGKTKGALAPNEFWYFWRRFFHFGEIQRLPTGQLKKIDAQMFVRELAAIESVFKKPLAMKAMIMNWNIEFLNEILEKPVFVFVKRNPFYNIQSLLEARQNYFGDVRGWYSFKPPEFIRLKDLSPVEQVAGQVYYTNKAIEESLETIPKSRQLHVNYERFCADPNTIFTELAEKLKGLGFRKKIVCENPMVFKNTNAKRLSAPSCKEIIDAYQKFSGEKLEL